MPGETDDEATHNPVFDKIVGDDTHNLTKLVAYSLYKKRKRDFIIATKSRENRPPIDTEIETYTNSAIEHLDSYVNEAESAMDAYVFSVISEERPNIEKAAITRRIEEAVSKLEGNGTILKQIGLGIFVWVVSLVILVVVAWGAQKFGIDLLDVLPRDK